MNAPNSSCQYIFMKITLLAISIIIASTLKAQTDSLSSGVYNLDSIRAKNIAGSLAKPRFQGSTRDLATLSYHTSILEAGKTDHPLRALDDLEELIMVKDGQLTININDINKTLGPESIALIVAFSFFTSLNLGFFYQEKITANITISRYKRVCEVSTYLLHYYLKINT